MNMEEIHEVFKNYKDELFDVLNHCQIGFLMTLVNKPEELNYKVIDKLRILIVKEISDIKIKIHEVL